MARPLRIEGAGGWYPVTARGNEPRPIFCAEKAQLKQVAKLLNGEI